MQLSHSPVTNDWTCVLEMWCSNCYGYQEACQKEGNFSQEVDRYQRSGVTCKRRNTNYPQENNMQLVKFWPHQLQGFHWKTQEFER